MWRRFLQAALVLGAAGSMGPATAAGCVWGRSELEVDLPDAGSDADADADADAAPPPIEQSGKVDLLLVMDNSPNTDTFHELFAQTAPYLVDRLVHPACVNGLGNVVATTPNPTDPCPVGVRDFAPITDIHLAVISTSLGGHGADICGSQSPFFDPAQDDAAHLLTRGPGASVVPTYKDQGFLSWDPKQQQSPPGDSDAQALTAKLADLARGVGSGGCGFESQLESIYRFLVDPDPYLTVTVTNLVAAVTGTDTLVLQQRADFLRPDSALMIALITDENDCSTREGGQYFLSNQGEDPQNPQLAFHLPRPRTECAKSPDDPCCASCGQATPPGCPPSQNDPNCGLPPMNNLEDPVNLRCFDQKRRFGIDFLHPVERYVTGLTAPVVATRDGSLVDNPLFTGNRSPKLVMMTGIVGVPWQDLAKDPKTLATGFAPGTELDWGLILGDPSTGAPPGDALMIESVGPRTGANPPTGVPLAPPGSPFLANPINGHERVIAAADDLQYACVYAKPTPTDCAGGACECINPDIVDNPICQAVDGSYSSTQRFARALPGVRELRVLQGLGQQGTVGSVCAAVISGSAQPTFGYKPSVDAILHALRSRIAP
jgi:hypothetical protein